MASQDSLAYHEPGISTVLIQAGFLLALNMVNTVLDKIIYCGLIGQLLIGMAWGVSWRRFVGVECSEVDPAAGIPRSFAACLRGLHYPHGVQQAYYKRVVDPVAFQPASSPTTIGWISKIPFSFCTSRLSKETGTSSTKQKNRKDQNKASNTNTSANTEKSATQEQEPKEQTQQNQEPTSTTATPAPTTDPAQNEQSSTHLPRKPRSLYPASIIGLAMVARGEIGYLIASLAETDGISSSGEQQSSGSSELYLVVVWAITLCTVIGPICVGTLVKRVKKLQAQQVNSGGEDPLGSWGVTS